MKSTVYFIVDAKDFNFPLSRGFVVRYGETASKVFDIFFCSNNKIMIIKILKLQYTNSLGKNEYLLANSSIQLFTNVLGDIQLLTFSQNDQK